MRRRTARHWPASPGAQRARGYTAAPQWGRIGSGCGWVVYRRFIAQCRLRTVGFTTRWCVYHHQLQEYLFRVSESLRIETGSQQYITECSAIGCPTITQPCSRVGWDDVPHIPFSKKKNRRKVVRSSMWDPERGLWEGLNFRELPQFLRSDWISFAYGLTSNKDQTFMHKSYFVFLLCPGICMTVGA